MRWNAGFGHLIFLFMRRFLVLSCLLFLVSAVFAQKPTHYYILLKTSKGDGIIKLYNETPLHRDNFVKLVQDGFYEDLLFHRVIENFMIQGGDPDSKHAVAGQRLGSGGLDYRVPAEFVEHLFHKKGALAAARTDNPEKESSSTQFYLVQGRTFSFEGLDSLQEIRLGGRQIPDWQREVYHTLGGVPHLDQGYTVYGELITGLELIDGIAAVNTDQADRPVEDERMSMQQLTRRESINLERQLAGLKEKNGVFVRFFDLFRPKYIELK